MEREVAAMATRLESSVGLKRKVHIPDYVLEFADDYRDVDIKGGMVAVDVDGSIIELPKTKGGEAESGSKEEKTKDGKGSGDGCIIELLDFADDYRDVDIKGGMVAVDVDGGIIELPKTKGGEAESGSKEEKTKDGKGSGDGGIIELPKTKGGEAESGSKEEGSSTTAKPAGARKRTKMVKYRMDKSRKHLFDKKPLPFDLTLCSESFAAALRDYLELERNILEQFKTKGYFEYEREEEVTDDEEDLISV